MVVWVFCRGLYRGFVWGGYSPRRGIPRGSARRQAPLWRRRVLTSKENEMYREEKTFSGQEEKYRNAQKSEPSELQIPGRIFDALQSLGTRINKLEDLMQKLDCLIPPTLNKVNESEKPYPPTCALAREIYNAADKIESLCEKLEAVQL